MDLMKFHTIINYSDNDNELIDNAKKLVIKHFHGHFPKLHHNCQFIVKTPENKIMWITIDSTFTKIIAKENKLKKPVFPKSTIYSEGSIDLRFIGELKNNILNFIKQYIGRK